MLNSTISRTYSHFNAYITLLLVIFCFSVHSSHAQSLLENLNDGRNDPVYTQYAAPPQRANNIVDQSYSFEFYRPDHGLVFGSEKGGHLSLAYKINGSVRYFYRQMDAPPRITTSYSDLVQHTYKPHAALRTKSTFQVYSSKLAIQQLTITNESNDSQSFSIYPFFQHQKSIHNVSVSGDTAYFTFKHGESTDAWARKNGLPHPDSLYNVYMVSRSPESFGGYPQLGPLNDDPTLPKRNLKQDPSIKEGGPVFLKDGSRCMEAQPESRMQVYLNESRTEILTERAPQADGDTLNIPGDGTQQLELSHFSDSVAAGDSVTVKLQCSNQQGRATETIPDDTDSVGVTLNLSDTSYVQPPQNVELTPTIPGYENSFLIWDSLAGATYQIYRGKASNPGHYSLIVDSLDTNSYFDFGLETETEYNYVIVTRDSLGRLSVHSKYVTKPAPPPPPDPAPPFFKHVSNRDTLLNGVHPLTTEVVGFQHDFSLKSGESITLRIARGKSRSNPDSLQQLISDAKELIDTYDVNKNLTDSRNHYKSVPGYNFTNYLRRRVYWNSFNILRQSVMPPEGNLSDYYQVSSRDPEKSWHKAGQTMFNTLSLLSLVHMNAEWAQSIQYSFMEKQQSDGYIPHRVGPYVSYTAETDGERTAAAPWFSWINWKIYQESRDQQFLDSAYTAGKAYYEFWTTSRDADGDGLSEWGGSAELESVRRGGSVIWDNVTDPSNVEALDLNTILVKEAQALSNMASERGDSAAADDWDRKAEDRAQKIRNQFWDDETGFFYNIEKSDNDFTATIAHDLKRKEIIGFLPLWADIPTSDQADQLVSSLKNGDEFWREYGIPSLAATDGYYSPIGRWNGPVWIPWQYLIFKGLQQYQFKTEAQEVVNRATRAVAEELKDVHTFRDRYSPDSDWASSINSYAGTGVAARMIAEAEQSSVPIEKEDQDQQPSDYALQQNYPNPFNPNTRIAYTLPRSTRVQITVHSISGQKVATLVERTQEAGRHTVQFHAGNLSSGIYIYRLKTGNYEQSRKMLLLK